MLARFVVALAAVTSALADPVILTPSSRIWWVTGSLNTLSWTCEDTTYTNWTVVVTNPDVNLLAAPMSYIANQMNYDCSKSVTPDWKLGPNYQIHFANPNNMTDFWVSSEPFEVKAFGSAYPTDVPVITPGASGTGTSGGTTGTGTGSSPQSTNTRGAALTTKGLPSGSSLALLSGTAMVGLIGAWAAL